MTEEPIRRRRGAQPGNLNAFKDGRYSARSAASYRMAPPGDMRDHLVEVVRVVVRLELARLGPHPTSEQHVAAVGRAMRRVHRAMVSRDYREARSRGEVFRWFHQALDTALTATPEAIEPPPEAARKSPENEGNE